MILPNGLTDKFIDKARAVSAVVETVSSMDEALEYLLTLCDQKNACQILVSGCELPLSEDAAGLREDKQNKIIAAPGLDAENDAKITALCVDNGFQYVNHGMRQYGAGVDIGFTIADMGIAETGTLVLDSSDEDLRLATMLSEFHVCVLSTSDIVADSYDCEEFLVKKMKRNANFTAFITGASRTADIERVLALGVHGPLELHILLLED